jgi:hypothetical protein
MDEVKGRVLAPGASTDPPQFFGQVEECLHKCCHNGFLLCLAAPFAPYCLS